MQHQAQIMKNKAKRDRRTFLGRAAAAATTSLLAGVSLEGAASSFPPQISSKRSDGVRREQQAYQLRVEAARRELDLGPVDHPRNGDEDRYAGGIANFTK